MICPKCYSNFNNCACPATHTTVATDRTDVSSVQLTNLLDAPLSSVADRRALKSELIRICAELLKTGVSEYAEDWPKSMPKRALQEIDKQNEKIRLSVVELRRIAERI